MEKITFIGRNIRFLRIRNNIRQYDMAGIIGITANKIRDYESERSIPPLNVLLSICDNFNIPADYFFSRFTLKQEPELYDQTEDMILEEHENTPSNTGNEEIKRKIETQKEQFYNELEKFNNILSGDSTNKDENKDEN